MIIIIGGGASGLMAAIAAGNTISREKITILEKNNRVGRKLLATGNGRCNLTNINASAGRYVGEHPGFCASALKRFGPRKTIEFFKRLGLVTKIEPDGRVYPKCGLASAVLGVLRNEISRLDIEVVQAEAVSLLLNGSTYIIKFANKSSISAEKVIVAAGGRAAPVFGSDGVGYGLLAQTGHRLTSTYPALVQLRTNFEGIRALSGIRAAAGVSIIKNGRTITHDAGELQFTNYGISGIPALNVSGGVGQGSEIVVDFFPDINDIELFDIMAERTKNLASLPAEQFFTGFFHKSIGHMLLKYAGISVMQPVSQFSHENISKLVAVIKSFKMPLSGTLGFAEAQVTGGGARTDDFDPETMESLKNKGLYAIGEVLDVYGPCGGYNLQWAWSSGYVAGMSAAGQPL